MFLKDKKHIKLTNQHSKLTLQKSKGTSQIQIIQKSKSKTKSLLKLNHSHQSLKQKNINQKEKYSPIATTISFTKSKPSFKTQLSIKKLNHSVSRRRISFSQTSKQPSTKCDNSGQKKSIKHNWNSIPNNAKPNSCLQLNQRTKSVLSHSNYSSNKVFEKATKFKPQVTELSQLAKSTDFSKMKKKKYNYIKNFYKTSLQENNCFCKKLQNSLVDAFNEETLRCMENGKINPINKRDDSKIQEISDQQLQQVNVKNYTKLQYIRININNLSKKLKKPNKSKLFLITNNYQKIISKLYQQINLQSQNYDLQKLQLSQIHTFNSKTKPFSHAMDTPHQNIVTIEDPSSENSVFQGQNSQSEHWDSYLWYEDGQKENRQNHANIGAVKKLDLVKMKSMNIRQYQDEFMDNQEVFSDSWKREINEKKRF